MLTPGSPLLPGPAASALVALTTNRERLSRSSVTSAWPPSKNVICPCVTARSVDSLINGLGLAESLADPDMWLVTVCATFEPSCAFDDEVNVVSGWRDKDENSKNSGGILMRDTAAPARNQA